MQLVGISGTASAGKTKWIADLNTVVRKASKDVDNGKMRIGEAVEWNIVGFPQQEHP